MLTRCTDGSDVAAGQELTPTAGGAKNSTSGKFAAKRTFMSYLYFLIFLLPHIPATQNNTTMMLHYILRDDQNAALISQQKERLKKCVYL